MVDFWEVLGRLVTNDTLRNDIYKRFSTGDYAIDGAEHGFVIPRDHYNVAREEVAKVISERPVSLMTLGELLFALSQDVVRDLIVKMANVIKTSAISVAGRSALFYTGLGAMIIDDTVRNAFDNNQFDAIQFKALSLAERTDLAALAKPSGALKSLANEMCGRSWDPDCSAKFNFYDHHTHPALNAPQPAGTPRLLALQSETHA